MSFHHSHSALAMTVSPARFLAAAVRGATGTALNAFKAAWRKQRADREATRALKSMADIDARMLGDIGAPCWLIAEAIERKHAYRLRLLELHRS